MDQPSLQRAMVDARPAGSRAQDGRIFLQRRLQESLQGLVKSAQTTLGKRYEKTTELIEAINPTVRLSPDVFLFHYRLLNNMTAGNKGAVAETLSNPPTRLVSGPSISIAHANQEDWEAEPATYLLNYPVPDRFGRHTTITKLSQQKMLRYEELIHDALDVISRCDKNQAMEIQAYCTSLRLFSGTGITGASSLWFYGAIYLREPYPEYNPLMYFIEHMIHESAHLHHNILETMDPLIHNGDIPAFKSPVRRDPRPLLGIYHAVFVLSRLAQFYAKLSIQTSDPIYTARLENRKNKLREGVSTLQEHAQFTSVGRELFESIEREMQAAEAAGS